MKHSISICLLCVAAACASVINPANAAGNVTQYHNDDSRDGLYIDRLFTQSAAANLARDLRFNGTITGNIYAQPLYIEDRTSGRTMVIVATESNDVYALDATRGDIVWQRNLGTAVSLSQLPCGNINPMGVTGTPVIDLNSRALVVDAMTTPDGGVTKKHLLY